jgi:hypothetical protein
VKVPRFRIAWLMIAVAIAGLDFAAIRAMSSSSTGELLILGALPMANVLAVGMLIGLRRPGSRPFLLGFEAFGAMALGLYVVLASFFRPEVVYPYLTLFLAPIEKIVGLERPLFRILMVCTVAVVMLGAPQVTFAMVGGLLSRRFKVTITRR